MKTEKDIQDKIVKTHGKYVEVNDAAEILGITYEYMMKKIKDGDIKGVEKYGVLVPLEYVMFKLFQKEQRELNKLEKV
jgi:hypothetical protein